MMCFISFYIYFRAATFAKFLNLMSRWRINPTAGGVSNQRCRPRWSAAMTARWLEPGICHWNWFSLCGCRGNYGIAWAKLEGNFKLLQLESAGIVNESNRLPVNTTSWLVRADWLSLLLITLQGGRILPGVSYFSNSCNKTLFFSPSAISEIVSLLKEINASGNSASVVEVKIEKKKRKKSYLLKN